MAKLTETELLIFLFENIEDKGLKYQFEFDDIFKEIKLKYNSVDEEFLKTLIKRCRLKKYIEIPYADKNCVNCGFELTKEGEEEALLKREENNRPFLIKTNSFIGNHKNIIYLIVTIISIYTLYNKF